MKIGKSGIWFLGLLTLASFALQDNRTIIIEQFNRAQGTWEGFMEYTDERDNKTKYSMPAKCTKHFDGKRWEYEVQYDEGNGELAGGKGECTVNEDGSKMNYNGVIWNVTDIIQSGDSVKIIMETSGKDNRKKTSARKFWKRALGLEIPG